MQMLIILIDKYYFKGSWLWLVKIIQSIDPSIHSPIKEEVS